MVAFSAAWCTPCRLMAPLLSKLADEFGLVVVTLDAASAPRSVQHYGVAGFPELMLFRGGVSRDRVSGFRSYDDLRGALVDFTASGG